MASDRLYPQDYRCPICNQVSSHYVWISKLEEATHECKCGQVLTSSHLDEKETSNGPLLLIRRMNKDQIVADRKKRSVNHFKKEIMPTIGGKDRKYFEKKYGKQ